MGKYLFDQYSILHFAVGIVFYFWGIGLSYSTLLHILFEYIENTTIGMVFINKFSNWPGGKDYADSLTNSIGDTLFFIFGWYLANRLDTYYKTISI
jgi:hypothetical protein